MLWDKAKSRRQAQDEKNKTKSVKGSPSHHPGYASEGDERQKMWAAMAKAWPRQPPEGASSHSACARSGPGTVVKAGLTRRVGPGLGKRRPAWASARHHGLGRPAVCACRRQPAQQAGVTPRCPSCHILIECASVPPVATHWPLAPPACLASAWHQEVEPRNAPGRCFVRKPLW